MLRSELFCSIQRIDVRSTPFPYSGGMTACEALWMGVPVVTCPGETFASRHSLSHLSNVGLTETIATDRREYIELALRLARTCPTWPELRRACGNRSFVRHCATGRRFAQHLMALLRDVWRQWCHQ